MHREEGFPQEVAKVSLEESTSLVGRHDMSHFLPRTIPSSLAPIRALLEKNMNIKHIFHML